MSDNVIAGVTGSLRNPESHVRNPRGWILAEHPVGGLVHYRVASEEFGSEWVAMCGNGVYLYALVCSRTEHQVVNAGHRARRGRVEHRGHRAGSHGFLKEQSRSSPRVSRVPCCQIGAWRWAESTVRGQTPREEAVWAVWTPELHVGVT